jgi:hypothetical protein
MVQRCAVAAASAYTYAAADAPSSHRTHNVDVCGVGAMLKVVTAGCRQCGFQLLGPFAVGLGEPPDLVGGQADSPESKPAGDCYPSASRGMRG